MPTQGDLKKSPLETVVYLDLDGTIDLTSETVRSQLIPGTKLNRIWDDYHIKLCRIDRVDSWKCRWCNKPFKCKHGTRVLWHLLQTTQGVWYEIELVCFRVWLLTFEKGEHISKK